MGLTLILIRGISFPLIKKVDIIDIYISGHWTPKFPDDLNFVVYEIK